MSRHSSSTIMNLRILCDPSLAHLLDPNRRTDALVQAGNDALTIIGELERRLKRYEDWRHMSARAEDEDRPANSVFEQLWSFYGVDPEDNEPVWFSGIWSDRPAWATHYCRVVTPLGPYDE